MDSSLNGVLLKHNELSVAEKRELVHEMSKNPDSDFQVMLKWNRKEILQILSAESGKEIKYVGFSKANIINILLKSIYEKTPKIERKGLSLSIERNTDNENKNISPTKQESKRQRTNSYVTKGKNTTINCKNVACQALLREDDLFCKRCSCSICYKYDDNKDTSFWLTCNSEAPFANESCGLSCHIDCAFKIDNSCHLEGCFYCVSCGKPNSFLERLKTQLINVMKTRRVDELCHRLDVAQKLLKGTKKYIKVLEAVDEVVTSLEADLNFPLTNYPTEMRRGLVNRLESATKVKKNCSAALRSLEKTPLGDLDLPSKTLGSTEIIFEKTVHGKSRKNDANVRPIKKNSFGENQTVLKEAVAEKLSNTLFKPDQIDDRQERPENAINKDNSRNCGFGLSYYVKIIRELECSGNLERDFRKKFLTWYCMKATTDKVSIVNLFIDTLKEDSEALAAQLVHSFSQFISESRSTIGTIGATPVVSD